MARGAVNAPVELEVGLRTVRISNPARVYFSARGETKLDLARYYLSVGEGIVTALRERPCMLHRFPDGVTGPKVHQKRIPSGAPAWIETAHVEFPSGREADELCVTELASVIWAVQMSTVEFHPWNSRRADVERPDEWRIDLDPMPRCGFATVRRVAHVVHELLEEIGAVGWSKTSGGNGLHVYVRIEPLRGFAEVRRAALAFAQEVERRVPELVTTMAIAVPVGENAGGAGARNGKLVATPEADRWPQRRRGTTSSTRGHIFYIENRTQRIRSPPRGCMRGCRGRRHCAGS